MKTLDCLGFDIGGTKCAVLRGNDAGQVAQRVEIPTGAPEETLETLFAAAEGWQPVAAAGISCGGPLDERTGVILSPPNLPGWDAIPIVRMVEERFGVPAALRNDANAGALAEWRFGAGRGVRNMVFLTFGTGMGAGLILNGRLYAGANGNAGEVGHWRLAEDGPMGYHKAGSFEGFVSGGGLAQLAGRMAADARRRGVAVPWADGIISAKTVAQAADAGDSTAQAVYTQCGERLGQALALVIDCLNPERVVIGSIFQRSEKLLRPAMERVLRQECLPQTWEAVQIVPAQLGDRIGDLAALSVAMERETGEEYEG